MLILGPDRVAIDLGGTGILYSCLTVHYGEQVDVDFINISTVSPSMITNQLKRKKSRKS